MVMQAGSCEGQRDVGPFKPVEGSNNLEQTMPLELTVSTLKRGGQIVTWGDFKLQIGAYPETIKDTMPTSDGVPQLYVVPEQLFDTQQGVTAAELEFPVYFNFFIKSRRLRFVCRRHQLKPLVRVLKEAVFGPRSVDVSGEYPLGSDSPGFPDLTKEAKWYKADPKRPRGRMIMADLIEPLVFDDNHQVQVDGTTITDLGGDRYRLSRDLESCEFTYQKPELQIFDTQRRSQPFNPPKMGVTILGSGHGFDAQSLTSGFIMWFNGKGVLVDPPVHTTAWLKNQNIDGRLVEDIILTHCHADHDSGTLQKVLEEGRITIHSTPTVMKSFVTKYASLTGLPKAQFERLFEFRPIPVATPVNIAGGHFTFKYMFHPIPTLGFSVHYHGASFAYSCDTLYDPVALTKLRDEGVLSSARCDDLINFDWGSDLILHEAGIPPIHTPVKVLSELPEDVRKRMYLTHVSAAAIPAESGLRLAPPGVENTLTLDIQVPEVSRAEQMLDVLAHVDIFQGLNIGRATEFLRVAKFAQHPAGATLVKTGDPGDHFFIIASGEVDIVASGQVLKRAGRYDYFGEIAMVLNRPRVADVVALTDVDVISITRQDFLDLTRGTMIVEHLRKVSRNKLDSGYWSILSLNSLLGQLSTFQKTQLLGMMETRQFQLGETLFGAGQPASHIYLLENGQVELHTKGQQGVKLGAGALLGAVHNEPSMPIHKASAVALESTRCLAFPWEGIRSFMLSNPGFFIRMLRIHEDPPLEAVL